MGRNREVVGRPRESAGACLGFSGAVRGGLQENEDGDTNTAAQQGREAAPKMYWRGHTGSVAKSGRRPEPTPRSYRGERWIGLAPCYAVRRTVSPVHRHSPVRYIATPRIGRARVGIDTGAMMPAQGIWSPVHLLGTVYMASTLRTVSLVRQHSPVRSVPPCRTGWATGSIQPNQIKNIKNVTYTWLADVNASVAKCLCF
jgi:hypothetical protein